MTDDTFDPYWHWLGIPPHERPVDHYGLLGLTRFESDPQRIEAAADARMNLVRSFQAGPRVAHTQKLLNELSAARLCLVNTQAKASYDAVLRGRQALSVSPAQYAANSMAPPFAMPPAPSPYASGTAPVATFAPPARLVTGPLPTAIPYSVTPPLPPPPPLPIPPVPPPVSPPRAAAAAASPAAQEVEELADAPRSLLASPWFMLALVLMVVGGAAGTWYLTRPQAPPLKTDIASTDDGGEASGSDGSASVSPEPPANPKTNPKTTTTRSTIDEPFGPVEIIQEGTGELHFSAQTAERVGDGLVLELQGDDQIIAGWSSADQNLAWNFRVLRPDVFRVELTYAATDEARGGRFAFQVDDDDPKAGEIAPTGALDKFRTDIFHVPVHRNGRHQLFLAVQDLSHSGSVVFQTLRFVPKGLRDKKKP